MFAHENGRVIPKEDKIFAINGRAKAMIAEEGKENVINATIGALLDDNGDLTVLSSVMKALGTLEPVDFAEYAPIGGTPEFKAAVEKALFGSKRPEGEVRVCATPGGTGAIRSVIANYSEPGDKVLTHDWYWANYKNIAGELGRGFETFAFFNEEGTFNADDFEKVLTEKNFRRGDICQTLWRRGGSLFHGLRIERFTNLVQIRDRKRSHFLAQGIRGVPTFRRGASVIGVHQNRKAIRSELEFLGRFDNGRIRGNPFLTVIRNPLNRVF